MSHLCLHLQRWHIFPLQISPAATFWRWYSRYVRDCCRKLTLFSNSKQLAWANSWPMHHFKLWRNGLSYQQNVLLKACMKWWYPIIKYWQNEKQVSLFIVQPLRKRLSCKWKPAKMLSITRYSCFFISHVWSKADMHTFLGEGISSQQATTYKLGQPLQLT